MLNLQQQLFYLQLLTILRYTVYLYQIGDKRS